MRICAFVIEWSKWQLINIMELVQIFFLHVLESSTLSVYNPANVNEASIPDICKDYAVTQTHRLITITLHLLGLKITWFDWYTLLSINVI